MDLAARFSALWHSVGAAHPAEVYGQVIAAYDQPQRKYHNVGHLLDCLRELDEAQTLAQRPAEVELALWFHDVVYKPLSSRNEHASASWATRMLSDGGAEEGLTRRVAAMIIATEHRELSQAMDAQLVVDIDLAVLGRAPAAYLAFEKAIREEYCWVPGPTYRHRRMQLLAKLLEREKIYSTEHFRTRYEAQARRNLRATVARLERGL